MSLPLSLLTPLFGGIVGAIQDGLQSKKETKQQEKTKEKQEDFEIERVKSIRDTNTYDLQESSSKWINIANFIRATTRQFLTYAFLFYVL